MLNTIPSYSFPCQPYGLAAHPALVKNQSILVPLLLCTNLSGLASESHDSNTGMKPKAVHIIFHCINADSAGTVSIRLNFKIIQTQAVEKPVQNMHWSSICKNTS